MNANLFRQYAWEQYIVTDGKLYSHDKKYHKYRQARSTMKSRYIYSQFIDGMFEYKYK